MPCAQVSSQVSTAATAIRPDTSRPVPSAHPRGPSRFRPVNTLVSGIGQIRRHQPGGGQRHSVSTKPNRHQPGALAGELEQAETARRRARGVYGALVLGSRFVPDLVVAQLAARKRFEPLRQPMGRRGSADRVAPMGQPAVQPGPFQFERAQPRAVAGPQRDDRVEPPGLHLARACLAGGSPTRRPGEKPQHPSIGQHDHAIGVVQLEIQVGQEPGDDHFAGFEPAGNLPVPAGRHAIAVVARSIQVQTPPMLARGAVSAKLDCLSIF